MKTTLTSRPCFEFSYPQLDTLVQVEETDDHVVIRATRDVFSKAQKRSFVHHLAQEGFIADSYRWGMSFESPFHPTIRWIIDSRWLAIGPEVRATARRFMLRLFFGAAASWLVLMWLFVVRPGH